MYFPELCVNFLDSATLLFDLQYKEDSSKKKTKTHTSDLVTGETPALHTNSSSSKKHKYNPDQKRGKDGRWVETNAEDRAMAARQKNEGTGEQAVAIVATAGKTTKKKKLTKKELDEKLEYKNVMIRGREYTRELRDDLKQAREAIRNASTQAEYRAAENLESASFQKFRDKLLSNSGLTEKKLKKMTEDLPFDDSVDDKSKELVKEAGRDFLQMTRGKGLDDLFAFTLKDDRAWAHKQTGELNIGKPTEKVTVLHELGHFLEYSDNRIGKAANEWIQRRKKSNSTEKLKDLTGNPNYLDTEFAYKGKFLDPYVSKHYDKGYTEVVSMGMERFLSKNTMKRFYKQDRSHFEFIVGVLTTYD